MLFLRSKISSPIRSFSQNRILWKAQKNSAKGQTDEGRVKPNLNVGTIGHVDHGKTTLTAAMTKVQLTPINFFQHFVAYLTYIPRIIRTDTV